MTDSEHDPLLSAVSRNRLESARRLVATGNVLFETLAEHSPVNVPLQLLLTSYIFAAEGRDLMVADAIRSIGGSPNVTWRWIMALQDAGLVQLTTGGRSGNLSLTTRGHGQVCKAIDAVQAVG